MRNKKLLMGVLFVAIIASLLFILPNTVNAAVSYTRNFPSNDGTIEINLTGLELDDSKQYEFSLVSKGGTPENWFLITDYTDTTARVVLSSGTAKIVDVLKITDNGQLFLREKNNTEGYIIDRLNVDLKLPYLLSIAYTKKSDEYNLCKLLYGSIGNTFEYVDENHTYSQFQKVTDTNFITKYLNIKSGNGNKTDLETYLPTPPTSGYSTDRSPSYSNKQNGLYILWVKKTGDSCKDVYGAIIHDGLPEATKVEQYIEGLDVEAPTVSSISVHSPSSGTYNTPQTVKVWVSFSEPITGTTVPTLKIRFGESPERTLTNGTIQTDTIGKNQIEYSYNIQDTDKGQLATVGLSGGNISDAAGNLAVLSCPLITGNTIKANVDGTTTNNTDNQDNKNDTTTENLTATVKYSSTKETTEPVTVTITANKKLTKVNGWTLSSDGKSLTKTYTVNAKESVTLKDEDGKTTTVSVNISNIKAGNGTPTPTGKSTPTPTPTPTNTTKDDTTMKGKIPQTGEEIAIILGIFAVLAIGAIVFIRYKKFEF